MFDQVTGMTKACCFCFVVCCRFGPEGKEYASGSEDGTIRIWQTDWQAQQLAAEQQQPQQAQQAQAAVQANGSAVNGRKA